MKFTKTITALLLAATLMLSACGAASSAASGESSQPVSESQTSESSEASGSQENSVSSEPEDDVVINVLALKGPTGIAMVELMQDTDKYNFTLSSEPTEAVAAIASGSADIAAIPTNLASNLYAKTSGGVEIIAVTTYGTLYILENGDTINSVEDLRGKTLYATGQGANPEYILNYILEKNGLTPGTDVTIEYKSEHSELAALAASGEVAIAMLPEPNVTSAMLKNSDLRIALDLTEEWNKVCNTGLVMGCLVVNRTFAEEHPAALAAFMKDAQAGVEYVLGDIDGAAALCETYEVIGSAALAKAAIPNCNFTFLTGDGMKSAVSDYLKVLLDANAASVGGALPGDDFYYGAA